MKKKGISLIVLIITIIVVIILAAVVILTLSKNNPIESAKEARFKEDVRTFQDELALYISKQYANAGGHWDGSISATNYDDIVKYIPSFTKKYEGKFIINNNNLEYTNNLDEKEKEFAQNLNITKRESILPDEFQQVEYIESTESQSIDTGLGISTEDIFYIKFKIPKYVNRSCVVGAGLSSTENVIAIIMYNNSCVFRIMQNNRYYDLCSVPINDLVEVYIKNNKINVGNIDKNEVKQYNYNVDAYSTPNMYLFSGNNVLDKSSCKIYNYIVYNQEKKKIDLIPCYSTTTVTDVNGKECPKGTVGMYDTVEGKFYTNQGTGEFIKGPDV